MKSISKLTILTSLLLTLTVQALPGGSPQFPEFQPPLDSETTELQPDQVAAFYEGIMRGELPDFVSSPEDYRRILEATGLRHYISGFAHYRTMVNRYREETNDTGPLDQDPYFEIMVWTWGISVLRVSLPIELRETYQPQLSQILSEQLRPLIEKVITPEKIALFLKQIPPKEDLAEDPRSRSEAIISLAAEGLSLVELDRLAAIERALIALRPEGGGEFATQTLNLMVTVGLTSGLAAKIASLGDRKDDEDKRMESLATASLEAYVASNQPSFAERSTFWTLMLAMFLAGFYLPELDPETPAGIVYTSKTILGMALGLTGAMLGRMFSYFRYFYVYGRQFHKRGLAYLDDSPHTPKIFRNSDRVESARKTLVHDVNLDDCAEALGDLLAEQQG